jgi:hypothetical protein
MVMTKRLAGDNKGNGDNNEGGGQWRGQGRQGNGNSNNGGMQGDGNSNEEGNGNKDEIGGRRGRQRPTFACHTTMTHDRDLDGDNNNNERCWTQQSTASVL